VQPPLIICAIKESLPNSLSDLEKGTDFLERKSLRMSRIEATLLGKAETVMATKSRTRPRNSIDWEGQTTLEGFTGILRRRRASRRNDMSWKQSF
jgi:hypothetical protein